MSCLLAPSKRTEAVCKAHSSMPSMPVKPTSAASSNASRLTDSYHHANKPSISISSIVVQQVEMLLVGAPHSTAIIAVHPHKGRVASLQTRQTRKTPQLQCINEGWMFVGSCWKLRLGSPTPKLLQQEQQRAKSLKMRVA
jgi:hypothetical protein